VQLAVAGEHSLMARELLDSWFDAGLDEEARIMASSVIDLDASESTCPACTGTIPQGSSRCPSCGLRIA